MIKNKKLFAPLLLLGFFSTFFISCKKNASNVAPQIILTSNSLKDSSVVNAGDSVKIEFTIKTENKLTLIEIGNSLGKVIQTFNDSDSKRTFSYRFKAVAGIETYSVIVMDTVNFKTVVFLMVTTKAKTTGISQGSMTDQQGNSYKTITIDSQTWMAENLRTTIYNDASIISLVPKDSVWTVSDTSKSAFACSFNNASMNSDTVVNYGLLYNWAAVNSQKLCPNGWHVPSIYDWKTLLSYLTDYGFGYGGSGSDIAKSMASTAHWFVSSQEGETGFDQSSNNSSGFSAVPGGIRLKEGMFTDIGKSANWWTSTDYRTQFAYSIKTQAFSSEADSIMILKQSGLSVRCLKNN